MSDNCLCGYQIYDLNGQGVVTINPRFLALWKAFFPRKRGADPLRTVDLDIFPRINPVRFVGTPTEEGFIDFQPLNFTPSFDSAVMSSGIALNLFTPSANRLDFELQWECPESVKYINFYFWNQTYGVIRLNLDSCDRPSSYYKRRGKARFQGKTGYLYAKCISTEPEFQIRLKVTALPNTFVPNPETGCLAACDEIIPLYTTLKNRSGNHIIPAPRWEQLANLIEETIDTITSLPVPEAPLQGENALLFMEREAPMRLNVGGDLQKRFTAYTNGNVLLSIDGVRFEDLKVAVQNQATSGFGDQDLYWSFQAVLPLGAGYSVIQLPLVTVTINITGFTPEQNGLSCDIYCSHRMGGWGYYPVSADGVLFQDFLTNNVSGGVVNQTIYIENCADVCVELRLGAPVSQEIFFTSTMSYIL